jgi:galactokinase/mevalonate kinase-like predicted kinase
MSEFIHKFFELKARQVLKQTAERMADLSFFKQIKHRIEAGEDLSGELPQLKSLTQKSALKSVQNLIKRCDTDLNSYWQLHKTAKAKVSVTKEFRVQESVPRFDAEYKFATEQGAVTVSVMTQGQNIRVLVSNEKVKKELVDSALLAVEKQLTLSTFA